MLKEIKKFVKFPKDISHKKIKDFFGKKKFENFLTPGTIIVSDGRTANCEFLLNNFKRQWIHHFDRKFDQHIFYLNSDSLGKYNKLQLKFYHQYK